MKFRKKPVVIEAFQWKPKARVDETPDWFFNACFQQRIYPEIDGTLSILTLERKMTAQPGDWLIKDLQDELYPCKPDFFAATYDPVD